MIYAKIQGKDPVSGRSMEKGLIVLEPENLRMLRDGQAAITPDNQTMVAYTGDPAWLVKQMKERGRDVEGLDELLYEASQRETPEDYELQQQLRKAEFIVEPEDDKDRIDLEGEGKLNASLLMRIFWRNLEVWSKATFGPREHRGPVGPLQHLGLEAIEAAQETDEARRREEIADCLFLVFDAAQRAGMSFRDLVTECEKKLEKNKARTWPDWRGKDPNTPIEHDRSKD